MTSAAVARSRVIVSSLAGLKNCDIAHAIERGSDRVLQVEHGSLYPALHRLENRGHVASFWGTSENNRKAKYYRLTPSGRKTLAAETSRWEQLVQAIGRVMKPAAD